MPAIVDRIQDMVSPGNSVYVLTAMHAFFAPLAGFCNSVAIGFNDEIQAQYSVCSERSRGKRVTKGEEALTMISGTIQQNWINEKEQGPCC